MLVLVNALKITVQQSPLALQMFLHGHYDCPKTWLKNGLFSPRNRPPRGTTEWHTPYSPPICIPLMAQSLWKKNDRPEFFRTISLKTAPKRPFLDTKSAIKSAKRLKAAGNLFVVRGRPTIFVTAPKRPFLDTKSAIERAKRLKTAGNLFVVMRVCSPVDFNYLDAGFEPRCGRKDFWTACLLSCCCCCYCCCFLLLLLKCVAHPWTPKGGVKPLEGKPRSVIKTRTMTELGPGLA